MVELGQIRQLVSNMPVSINQSYFQMQMWLHGKDIEGTDDDLPDYGKDD